MKATTAKATKAIMKRKRFFLDGAASGSSLGFGLGFGSALEYSGGGGRGAGAGAGEIWRSFALSVMLLRFLSAVGRADRLIGHTGMIWGALFTISAARAPAIGEGRGGSGGSAGEISASLPPTTSRLAGGSAREITCPFRSTKSRAIKFGSCRSCCRRAAGSLGEEGSEGETISGEISVRANVSPWKAANASLLAHITITE